MKKENIQHKSCEYSDENILELIKSEEKVKNVEKCLRKKCHRYKTHIKEMSKGIIWRNELITELLLRLGYNEFETEDFRGIFDNLGDTYD